MNATETSVAIAELYQSYADALDAGDIERWPEYFTEDAIYRVQPRDNYDRKLPLATMFCEGRGMFLDRVVAITKVLVFAPRYVRHVVSTPRIMPSTGDAISSQASFCAFQTLPHRPTELLSVGRYLDTIVRLAPAELRFRERLVVYDSLLIPNSLVYPL